jgi:hypothetical protein
MRALSEIVDTVNTALNEGRCNEARVLLTEAFPIVDSRTVVKMILDMAESAYAKKRVERAEQYLRLALNLHERCFPAEIPARFAKRTLAEILQEQGRVDEAEILLGSLEMKS